MTVPGHGPGDIAHGQFIFFGPAGGLLNDGWIVRRVGDGGGLGGQESKNHRQTGGPTEKRNDEVTQFAQRQIELVEQQIKETDAVSQDQRGQQHQEVLGIDLGGILGKLSAVQRLRQTQHGDAHEQKVAQPSDGQAGAADQQTHQEEGGDPTTA